MSAPTRQRSLRERLHGIGISWQGKKSKSYHSKEGKTFTDVEAANPVEDSRSCDPIPSTEEDLKDEGERSPVEKGHEKKPLSRTVTQPHGTEQYKVAASDTLANIAARFDTTPSELAKLNRLAARIVFPGQVLFVPEKRTKGAEGGAVQQEEKPPQEVPPQFQHLTSLNDDRRFSVPEALRIPYRRPSERAHRFLKVKARHFTDGQGVVSGVLIITPNAVMFDPNVSDPLVIEHGIESYGVIAPLDMLMRTAIYFDIAHMKVQNAPLNSQPQAPKPDVYYGKMPPQEASSPVQQRTPPPSIEGKSPSRDPAKSTTPPKDAQDADPKELDNAESKELDNTETGKLEGADLTSSNGTSDTGKKEDTESKEVDATETKVQNGAELKGTAEDEMKKLEEAETDEAPTELNETPERVNSLDSEEGSGHVETRRERMLKRLSYPMESITSFSRILTSSPKSLVDFSGALFSKGSEDEEKTEKEDEAKEENAVSESPAPVVGYKNLVEEKPEIFEALDRLLIERGAAAHHEHEGPPLYLCLRMGIPKERKSQHTPVLSYGKKRARSEYWFSIPHNRVEDLYCFLQQWIPQLYGDVDDVDPDAIGFQLINDEQVDEDDNEEEFEVTEGDAEEDSEKKAAPRSFLKLVEEHFGFRSISPSDWEVLSLSEMDQVPFSEMELPLPELLLPSVMLEEAHIKELYTLLPARAVGYPWTQIFSTETDGFNLKTLYRKMSNYDTPVLIAVQDTKGAIFGALLSSILKPSDHFYGTGESFLYTFHPEFKIFRWSGKNTYFVKGDTDSVAIGSGEGQFGLWVDGDLFRGSSNGCQTFDNEPLASEQDFVIKALEAWGFI